MTDLTAHLIETATALNRAAAPVSAYPPSNPPFCTYRVVTEQGRTLRMGFSAPNPSFGLDPDDAAEWPDYDTAKDMADRLAQRMAERLVTLNLPAPHVLIVARQEWPERGMEWWNAMQRFDRTAIETHRAKASVLPKAFQAAS